MPLQYPARSDSRVATICGCGVQGRIQLKSLVEVLQLEKVYAYDLDEALSGRFAGELSEELRIEITPVKDLSGAVRVSDVSVTCTPSREPILMRGDVPRGAFVAAVGADNPLKQELDPELMAGNKVVVDILEQCATIGDLRHAIEARIMRKVDVYAELGRIVSGLVSGRTSNEETIILDPTGTALQDVAAASIVYEKALRGGVGVRLNMAE